MSVWAVIDFETTGLSPTHGAKPTEIGICLVEDGRIIDRYQSLMNPGISIPFKIQQLTGITDSMLKKAPSVSTVMNEAADFVADFPLLAHNASFDRKFWEFELKILKRKSRNDLACSLLLSRRLFPELMDHRLETLVNLFQLPVRGSCHRAMADAECTAHLFLRIKDEIRRRFNLVSVNHELLIAIQSAKKHNLHQCIREFSGVS